MDWSIFHVLLFEYSNQGGQNLLKGEGRNAKGILVGKFVSRVSTLNTEKETGK